MKFLFISAAFFAALATAIFVVNFKLPLADILQTYCLMVIIHVAFTFTFWGMLQDDGNKQMRRQFPEINPDAAAQIIAVTMVSVAFLIGIVVGIITTSVKIAALPGVLGLIIGYYFGSWICSSLSKYAANQEWGPPATAKPALSAPDE